MEIIDNNTNNIYIIKRRLADLKMQNGGHYEYMAGNFCVKIFAHRIQEQPNSNINLVACKKVDVVLQEKQKEARYYDHVYIGHDLRFKNYEPIQYDGYNHYDLNKMPLINLCELIKYLHKLSNLAVFA